jgi:hypothetical protein
MKPSCRKNIFFSVVLLLAELLASPAIAQKLSPASQPSASYHSLVRRLSTNMCERLASKYRNTDFDKLAPDSIQPTLARLSYHALMAHADAVEQLVATSANGNAAGNRLVQDALLDLVEQCPPARPLLARAGVQQAGQTSTISKAELEVLQPVAQTICQQLDAAEAKHPFSSLTPERRVLAMQLAVNKALQVHRASLTSFYHNYSDPVANQQLRLKVGQLVLKQCPKYLTLLSRDVMAGDLANPLPDPASSAPALPPARK